MQEELKAGKIFNQGRVLANQSAIRLIKSLSDLIPITKIFEILVISKSTHYHH